jgi:subtilisin-like proprotein convertase family protein
MKKFLSILVLLSLVFTSKAWTQDLWQRLESSDLLDREMPERSMPEMPMEVYQLDIEQIKEILTSAPREFSTQKGVSIELPIFGESLVTFSVFDSPVMESNIAARHPQIRSFVGISKQGYRVHLGFDDRGFYAMTKVGERIHLIDLYNLDNDSYYSVYKMMDYPSDYWTTFKCENNDHEDALHHLLDLEEEIKGRSSSAPVALRTFRLAMATTRQYSGIFGGTKPSVLAELNKMVNRINLVLYNEMAARLLLIDKTEDIIQLEGNAYTNGNSQAMINENPVVLFNNGVVPDDYDIGHVVGTNGGGLAQLFSLCTSGGGSAVLPVGSNKARGVSTWFTVIGDPFHIQVVAHEVGHQFGSPHSFNNCNFGGNESDPTGFEPGSGHTIMSYLGLCGPDNAEGDQIDGYNWYSLQVMYNNIASSSGSASNCGLIEENVNTRPTAIIDLEGGFSIPIGTPFRLQGRAEDNESSQSEITYSWEQADIGPKSRLGQPEGTAPLFRVYPPSSSPIRYFPIRSNLYAGIQKKEEVLPQISRPLNFRLVVRDNDSNGGAFNLSSLQFFSTAAAGPFRVLTSTAGKTYSVGEFIELEWDVANTDKAPVNCQRVDVLVTTNRGNTYSMIAEGVLNNGRIEIEIPNLVSNNARFVIRAADNIFYNISDGDFRIEEPQEEGLSIVPLRYSEQVCIPGTFDIDFQTRPLGGFSGTAEVSYLGGLPNQALVSFDKTVLQAEDELKVTIEIRDGRAFGVYDMELAFTASNDSIFIRRVQVDISSLSSDNIKAILPLDGAIGVQGSPVLTWSMVENADSYFVRIRSLEGNIDLSHTTVDTFFNLGQTLPPATVLYWTVNVINRCGFMEGDDFQIFSFAMVNSSCEQYAASGLPISIPANNTRVVTLEVPNTTIISDVNLPIFRGLHPEMQNLSATLIGPSGSSARIFSRSCGTQNFSAAFDDDSGSPYDCIPNGLPKRTQFRELSNFEGEDGKGTWRIEFTDHRGGGSVGQIQEIVMELCGDIEASQPRLVTNELLEVPSLQFQTIGNIHLRVEDDGSAKDDVYIVILELPKKGRIEVYKEILKVGDRFTQSAIDDFGVIYYHTGEEEDTMDSFKFIVVNENGGFFGTGIFNILIGQEFTVSQKESLAVFSDIKVYPNPARNNITIEFGQGDQPLQVDLMTLNGQVLRRWNLSDGLQKSNLALEGMGSGVHILRFAQGNKVTYKKLIVQ